MICPLCEKRKAKRYCPAKGEMICAICCGEKREVSIDCSSDCPYLIAAHRWEREHRKPIAPDSVPYPDLDIPMHLVHERRPVISGLGFVSLTAARLIQHLARPSFGDRELPLEFTGRRTFPRRAHQFPEANSLSMALSSSASARSFFSRPFSVSSSLSRFASSAFIPPY